MQVQETDSNEKQAGDALHTGESDLGTGEESNTGQQTDVNQNTDSVSQNSDSVNHIEPKSPELVPEPQPVWPTHFEPGRYENLPNEVYHSANGISSTQLKDVRISPMYYYGRHIAKTIPREQNDAMLRGTIIHSYVLEPEIRERICSTGRSTCRSGINQRRSGFHHQRVQRWVAVAGYAGRAESIYRGIK